jgi:REP element-mobilizing transposase RayT
MAVRGRRRRNWGGRRPGAGRKRGGKPSVAHVARPPHEAEHPLHVTLRVLPHVPNLREKSAFKAIEHAVRLANRKGRHRHAFRITHYSVQNNHLHLIAEANDELKLSRGMQGLAVRIARRLNIAVGRRGTVFESRYHARPLFTPRQVRVAIAYVLLNERRHLAANLGRTLPAWYFDPCSSAREFDGWRPYHGLSPPPHAPRDVTAPPQSRLLRSLWRRHGLIKPDEVPGISTPPHT